MISGFVYSRHEVSVLKTRVTAQPVCGYGIKSILNDDNKHRIRSETNIEMIFSYEYWGFQGFKTKDIIAATEYISKLLME